MQITVDCYGVTARLAGGAEQRIALEPGARILDALDVLGRRAPDLRTLLPSCACAIGDHVVPRAHVLQPGERLALLPPVSGG